MSTGSANGNNSGQGNDTPPVTGTAILLGAFVALAALSVSAVSIALPVLGQNLGVDASGTAWILASYALTMALGTAIFGRVADLRGLRTAALIGVGVFVLGALVAALGPSLPVIVIGRLIQGAGGGSLAVVALDTINARFEGSVRQKATGTLLAVVSVLSGSGTLIGGLLTDFLNPRVVIALPVVSLILVVPLLRITPKEPSAGGSFDLRGAALITVAVAGLVFLLQSPSVEVSMLIIAGAAGLTVLGVVGTVWHVRRRPGGFLPRVVVTNGRLMLGALTALSLQGAYFVVLFAAPLLLSEEGLSSLQIGLLLLPAAAFGAVSDQLVGSIVGRVGPYKVAAGLATGSVAALLIAAATSTPVLLVVAFALGITGFTAGQVALLDPVSNLVESSEQGVAVGVFNLFLNLGGAIGTATVGGLTGLFTLSQALLILVALPAVGGVAALAAQRLNSRSAKEGSREPSKA